jgi:transketolase
VRKGGWSAQVAAAPRFVSEGAFASGRQLLKKFGFTAEHVVTAAKDQIALRALRDKGRGQ